MQLSIVLYIRCVRVVTYVTFYHVKLSHFSKVYVHSYSFHEGLGHDLMLVLLKYISFLISQLLCLFPSMSNCKTLFTRPLPVIAYTKHSFMKTQRPMLSLLS